jgi:DNA polymerase elongation subunit (family B)
MRVEFDSLEIRRQYRDNSNPFYYDDLIGYDTETYEGRAVLITDSKGAVCHPESFSDCINFLTRKKYRGVLGWFKNLAHDVDSILKWLYVDVIKILRDKGELRFSSETEKIELFLIDRKMLKLTRHKNSFTFFDIGNFLKGSLEKLAKQYLSIEKLEAPVDWKKVVPSDFKKPDMITYCKRDSLITEKLSQNFIDACNRLGIFTKNFCSPASLARHYFMSHVNIPTLGEVTRGRKLGVKFAYNAYKGGFISTFKKGYFEKVHLYDINSAYPFEIAKLPNLAKGRFVYGKDKVAKGAFHGWMHVKIFSKSHDMYSPEYYNPIAIYIRKLNKNFYFGGNFECYITLDEYRILRNDFDIQIVEGYYWIPNELELLYNDIIYNLYEMKSNFKNKDESLYDVIKKVMNGFYGLLIQKIPIAESKHFRTGNLFNPFHAAYITAGCRIQVYKAIKQFGAHDLIAVMTDGIAFSTEKDFDLSNELGMWGPDMIGEGVFIGSGLYTIRNEIKSKTATRGFSMRVTNRVDDDPKSVDFFTMLSKNLDKTIMRLPQKIRLSYKEALRLKKFAEWNVIQDDEKRININCDTKRIWAREFKNCRDVLENVIDSQPIILM